MRSRPPHTSMRRRCRKPLHLTDAAVKAQRGSVIRPKPHGESAQEPGSNLGSPLGSLWHTWSSLLPPGDKVQAPSGGDNAGEAGAAQLAWGRGEMRMEHKPGGRARGQGPRAQVSRSSPDCSRRPWTSPVYPLCASGSSP